MHDGPQIEQAVTEEETGLNQNAYVPVGHPCLVNKICTVENLSKDYTLVTIKKKTFRDFNYVRAAMISTTIPSGIKVYRERESKDIIFPA